MTYRNESRKTLADAGLDSGPFPTENRFVSDRCSFWAVNPALSDQEIIEYVDKFAANAVNCIIIGGGDYDLHYLFDSVNRPLFDDFMDCCERLVNICHQRGIKVILHHSNTFLKPERVFAEWEPMLQLGFADDGKSIVRLQDGYATRTFCPNNQEFREYYWSILKSMLKRVPFDGIMSDDASFYGGCSCAVCREKYQKEYHGDLGELYVAAQQKGTPAWRQWHLVRKKWMTEFHIDLYRRIHKEFPNLFFPYVANDPGSPWPSQISGIYPELYTLLGDSICWELYQPADFYSIRRISVAAAIYRELCESPAMRETSVMMLPFADTDDRRNEIDYQEENAMWAFAKTAGLDFCLCRVRLTGMAPEQPDRDYYQFEKNYLPKGRWGTTAAEIGVFLSADSRDIDPAWEDSHLHPFNAWCEAIKDSGYEYRAVQQATLNDGRPLPRLLIMPNVFAIEPCDLASLVKYVQNGGTLLINGALGLMDPLGNPDPGLAKQVEELCGGIFDWEMNGKNYRNGNFHPTTAKREKFCNFTVLAHRFHKGRVLILENLIPTELEQTFVNAGEIFHARPKPEIAATYAGLAAELAHPEFRLVRPDGGFLPCFDLYAEPDGKHFILTMMNSLGGELPEGTIVPKPSTVVWAPPVALELHCPAPVKHAERLDYPSGQQTETTFRQTACQFLSPEKFTVLRIELE